MARMHRYTRALTRRDLLKLGLGVGGSLLLGCGRAGGGRSGFSGDGSGGALKKFDAPPTPIRFTPFTRPLPVQTPLAPGPAFATSCTFASGVTPNFYEIHERKALVEIIPGVQTEIWGYNGQYPGPLFRARMGHPDVVRQVNELDVETSTHQHGGHNPSNSDGLPLPDQLVFPGNSKDYCYPNQSAGGDPNDNPSTLWYHDHATDITGQNVYHGLAGFYLVTDDLEQGLIDDGVLPGLESDGSGAEFDVPLALQDRRFNADGSLFFDPFDFDGFLGDVFVVNGKAQPFLKVQRRKYRFRILAGTTARMFLIRLSNGAPFLQIGNDSWLLPFAIQRDRILMNMAQRADVIVDFSHAPDEVFLENILVQDSGRGPGGDLQNPDVQVPGVPLVKFIVEGSPVANDATVAPGTKLRPNTPIGKDEIVRTRHFEFNRSDGAWQVNGQFYDPARSDADPRLGTAERWVLKNGGGGWWHPIHIHLEAHQVQKFNGKPPPLVDSFKKDTTNLGPGDEAEVFIRFRDHLGRFVMHCHNNEHEDDAMMIRWDVVTP
jgi:FtsP/CotA-like multicopper oxidase with cupredoxin domain